MRGDPHNVILVYLGIGNKELDNIGTSDIVKNANSKHPYY